jgi:hypothetical protein
MSRPYYVRTVRVDAGGEWAEPFAGIQVRIPPGQNPIDLVGLNIEVKLEPVPVNVPPWAAVPEKEPLKMGVDGMSRGGSFVLTEHTWMPVADGVEARLPPNSTPQMFMVDFQYSDQRELPEKEPLKVYLVWGTQTGLVSSGNVVVLATLDEIKALRTASMKGRWMQTLEVDDDQQEGP